MDSLQLTQEWDKVFPQSDLVDHPIMLNLT